MELVGVAYLYVLLLIYKVFDETIKRAFGYFDKKTAIGSDEYFRQLKVRFRYIIFRAFGFILLFKLLWHPIISKIRFTVANTQFGLIPTAIIFYIIPYLTLTFIYKKAENVFRRGYALQKPEKEVLERDGKDTAFFGEEGLSEGYSNSHRIFYTPEEVWRKNKAIGGEKYAEEKEDITKEEEVNEANDGRGGKDGNY